VFNEQLRVIQLVKKFPFVMGPETVSYGQNLIFFLAVCFQVLVIYVE